MAIRFQCSSCSQPIEVDDEWASKAVACPYCRKTITAPGESTISDLDRIPTASPLVAGDAELSQPPPPSDPTVLLPYRPNRIALVAFALACVVVVIVFVAELVIAPHNLEIEEFANSISSAASFSERLDAQTEFFKARGGVPPWMAAILVFTVIGGLTWIASVVCALIAIRRPQRRRFAAAALVITALIPLFFCCGGMIFGPGT